MSRTKIVATYGPACASKKILTDMLRAGLDVIRLNVSHLDPKDLAETVRRVRGIAAAAKLPLAVLADMPGPKIRCTNCVPERFELRHGDRILVAAGKEKSTPERLVVSYPHLMEDVKKGHEIAVNDGLALLQVEKVNAKKGALECVVERGGEVASRKGVSFLQTRLRIDGMTARDRAGLAAAAESAVDFIALSFVRSANDLKRARRFLVRAGKPDIPIVAKIEQREALDHFEEILAETDGVMVARGDMGIEKPLEEVPLLQKDIIRQSNETGRFVITATQMLESMTQNALPTRAEVSDVANAILDGSDAVMLSGETAVGSDPANVARMMTRIALAAEKRIDPNAWLLRLPPSPHAKQAVKEGEPTELDDALSHAACRLAYTAKLDALICLSFYGSTARRIARFRPRCPIYVLSPYEEQCRRLAITWGVEVFAFPEAKGAKSGEWAEVSALIPKILRVLRRQRRLQPGNRVVVLAGVPLDAPGGTNWLRVVEV